MKTRKPPKVRTIKDLATKPKNIFGWGWEYASKIELEYVNMLNPKALLDYRREREEEVFIDHL